MSSLVGMLDTANADSVRGHRFNHLTCRVHVGLNCNQYDQSGLIFEYGVDCALQLRSPAFKRGNNDSDILRAQGWVGRNWERTKGPHGEEVDDIAEIAVDAVYIVSESSQLGARGD